MGKQRKMIGPTNVLWQQPQISALSMFLLQKKNRGNVGPSPNEFAPQLNRLKIWGQNVL